MPLTAFTNIFAGNPLDRASDRRSDAAWIAAQLAAPDALALPLWNGAPFIEDDGQGGVRLAYIPPNLAEELSAGIERLLFLGLWKTTAVFAVDLEGQGDPAALPLAGLR